MALRLRLGAFAPLFFLVLASAGDAFGYRIPKAGTDYRLLSSCPNAPNAKFVCVRLGPRGADANGLAEAFRITTLEIREANPDYTLALCEADGGQLTRGWGFIMPDQAEDPQFVRRMRRSNVAWEHCPMDRRLVALIPGSVVALPRPPELEATASCPTLPSPPPKVCPPQTEKTVTVARNVTPWWWYEVVVFGFFAMSAYIYLRWRYAKERKEWKRLISSLMEQARKGNQYDALVQRQAEEPFDEEDHAETVPRDVDASVLAEVRLRDAERERDALREELEEAEGAVADLHRAVTRKPMIEQMRLRARIRVVRCAIEDLAGRTIRDAERALQLLHEKGHPPKPIEGPLVEQVRKRVRAVRKLAESLKSQRDSSDQPESEPPPESEQAE